MEINDIKNALAAASEEDIQAIRELVAPSTKLQRLQGTATALANLVEERASAARNIVALFASKANNGDATAVPPTWEELLAAFSGK